ncbi:hypothetical protein WJX77_004890 [Trebouxia sp. C0004]
MKHKLNGHITRLGGLAARRRNACRPLHCAAQFNRADIAHQLILAGSGVCATDKQVYTAYTHALANAAATMLWGLARLQLAARNNAYGALEAQGRQARDWLTGLVCAALLCLQRSHTVCPCPTAAWRRRGCPDSNGGPKSPYMSFHAVPQSPDNRLAGFLAWMRQSARVQGWAPLHCAAQAEKTDVVDMLLSHGADAQAADAEGWTPLHCATKDRPAAFMLLGFGADANAMSGFVPLDHAAATNHAAIAKTLLSIGADPDAQNGQMLLLPGSTPLHLLEFGQKDTLRTLLLLHHRADMNAPNSKGQTPLHWAARRGYASVVKELIAAVANVNATDNQGAAPLQHCSEEIASATSA